ncbi:hypothetical protein Cylst_5200 [Cylindrospermum stagnale PCC 7417]|uniref:Uncharacterized protein n=1 Tax=Cylindrospermum stagnale PCC 7417 TaxID=56107 RepID=K9X595_9NOST|nr:hypothetical protein [Cylindrospermum stagnale]AFZ27236.1 hypothetical protein Cylst_5200 [Cylindrospermum stagnale PCC 7417]
MNIHTQNLKLSPQLIKAAKEWIADCTWRDITEDDIELLSDEEIERGIQRHYSGGIEAFKQACSE